MLARLLITIGILIGLAFGGNWVYEASRLNTFQAGFTGSYTYNLLFESAVWLIPIAILSGILLGTFTEKKEKAYVEEGKILRHNESMFFQHWGNALATLLLIGTGVSLGFLFLPRFLTATQDVGFALNLHFIAANMFLFIVFYHITKNSISGEIKENMPKAHDIKDAIGHYKAMFGLGKQPEEGKYLASERLSYPAWGVMVGGIIITGLIKVSAYVWSLPEGIMTATTLFHGLFTIGMIGLLVAHVILGAIIPPAWPLLRSMLTGYISEKHVKEHHVKWYKQIKNPTEEDYEDQDQDTNITAKQTPAQ